jgi:hypothetical protein
MDPKKPVPLPPPGTPAPRPPAEVDPARRQDEELDQELDGTFPASDPLPWHHGS